MDRMKRSIQLVGAHGGYNGMKVPLGGGATIFECLVEAWKNHPELSIHMLSPGPAYSELRQNSPVPLSISETTHPASLGYLDYARFSREFERSSTEHLISRPRKPDSWVIANDICEGPDVPRLKAHGYKVITLVHVDVVDFITSLYLKRRIRPEKLTSGWRFLHRMGVTRLFPDILKLIFDKQESAFAHSDFVVVPSLGMKQTILDCYPYLSSSRVVAIPWGNPSLKPLEPPAPSVLQLWKNRWNIQPDDFVILTLSRISEEKGIDRLLLALIELEKIHPTLASRCHAIIVGDAAYMTGPVYLKHLQRLAGRLKSVRVTFTGHQTGEDKSCAFACAHLYAFLSRHESYGLTLLEALSAGLPALISREVEQRQPPHPHIIPVDTSPSSLAHSLAECVRQDRPSQPDQVAPPLFTEAAGQLLDLMV